MSDPTPLTRQRYEQIKQQGDELEKAWKEAKEQQNKKRTQELGLALDAARLMQRTLGMKLKISCERSFYNRH